MGEAKERLDLLLVNRGYFDTREKARKNIMAGLVFVDNARVDKSGDKVKCDAKIEIKGEAVPYVSRGGLKLEKAIKEFNIDLNGKNAMDVGASTGGFTDCMLKNGASRVYAVDVGYGQLAWELRVDPRVVNLERTNIRYVKPEDIQDVLDFATIDVAFISLKLVVPVLKNLIKSGGEIVALVKPQFEAGRERVGKKGVVKEPQTHMDVLSDVIPFILKLGFKLLGLTFSPVKGPEGNIEYLAYLKYVPGDDTDALLGDKLQNTIENIVRKSHEGLD